MATISWTTILPSDSSRVALGPKDIRSVWTSVDVGLDHSLCPIYWSQDSRGEVRPGGFRTYYGATSTVSNDGSQITVGRAQFDSTLSILYLLHTTRTVSNPASEPIGSRLLIEHESLPGDGNAWVEETGSSNHTAAEATRMTTTFSRPFAEAPTVFLTSGTTDVLVAVTAIGIADFTSYASEIVTTGSVKTVFYRAIGKASAETL